MKYEFDAIQIGLVETAIGEKEFSLPKAHPARKAYQDLRKYIRECRRGH